LSIGDLSNFVLNIGSFDCVKTLGVTIMELNIFEDMESPTGPFGDAVIVDGSNSLDMLQITGKEPVTVSMTANDFSSTASFNLSLMQNVEVKPGSSQGSDGAGGGSLYHKEYKFKFCAPEYVTCQGNYVNGEYQTPCSSIVEDIVTRYFPATVGFSCPDPTQFTRRMIARYEHPLKFLNRVIDDSISTAHKSSLYVLYKNRSSYVYETYENAFNRTTDITLTLYNVLKYQALSYKDKINSLMHVEGEAFYRPSRPQNKNYVVTYNMDTGEVTNAQAGTDIGPVFKVLGQYIYTQSPNPTTGVPIFHIISPENNPEPFALADAKRYRLAFQSHLMQNSITFICVANPNINIGSVVTLNIPNDFYSSGEQIEKQLSLQFCVTAINHKVRGINMVPRYIMICRAVKAAFAVTSATEG